MKKAGRKYVGLYQYFFFRKKDGVLKHGQSLRMASEDYTELSILFQDIWHLQNELA